MDKFDLVRKLGQGAFGEVTEVIEKSTGERCAVKVISNRLYETWQECLKLREVRALRQLGSLHPNIVVLKQVIRENKKLFLVFDYHPMTLHKRIQQLRKRNREIIGPHERFPMDLVTRWSHELLSATAYMHRYGFFHRDIKPENLLLDENDCIKVCDFGLARDVRSRPPFTDYVSTKWYRAPELVLRSTVYNSPVDIWACACVMAEILVLLPLFPAKDKIEQLLYFLRHIGPITSNTWPKGYALLMKQRISLPEGQCSKPLKHYLYEKFCESHCDESSCLEEQQVKSGISLICDMLQIDPNARLSAKQCLHHPFVSRYEMQAPKLGEDSKRDYIIANSNNNDGDNNNNKKKEIVIENSPETKGGRLRVLRRDSELRLLTEEIDELAKEVQNIKTSPVHSSLKKNDIVVKAESPIATPAKPKAPPPPILERKTSMERRQVVSKYLETLDDDDEDDDDEYEIQSLPRPNPPTLNEKHLDMLNDEESDFTSLSNKKDEEGITTITDNVEELKVEEFCTTEEDYENTTTITKTNEEDHTYIRKADDDTIEIESISSLEGNNEVDDIDDNTNVIIRTKRNEQQQVEDTLFHERCPTCGIDKKMEMYIHSLEEKIALQQQIIENLQNQISNKKY